MSDTGEPGEVPLVGEGATPGIVRVGKTVRRPMRPSSPTIHAYLAHLQARGFGDAPAPLGVDHQGREILTYIEGDVPTQPLPSYACRSEVLVSMARLIRRLHDASQDWRPPSAAVWGGLPGRPPAANKASFEADDLVSHCDYCPGNVVFRDGVPAALIDFDLARPTTRVADIANALYWWAPLVDPVDRAPSLVDADIPARVSLFADAYAMTKSQRRGLMPFAVTMVHRFHVSSRAAAEADPAFRRMWEQGVREKMPRAEAWIAAHADSITSAL